MGGEQENQLFNSIYNDISVAFGIDIAIQMYQTYKGMQITFPTRLFNPEYVKKQIPIEFDGTNAKQLAMKYGYSEKTVRRMIKEYMLKFMDDYGITLLNFSVNNISADENDGSYKVVKEAMAVAAKMRWGETAKADTTAYTERTVGTAKADVVAYEQQKAGYTYQQKRSYDVMDSAASNESQAHNEFMGMGMGLAMGNKMGAVVGTQMGNMAAVMDVTPDNSNNQVIKRCIKCNAEIFLNSKFCPECGSSQILKCPNCNAEVQGNSKFCHECGNKF